MNEVFLLVSYVNRRHRSIKSKLLTVRKSYTIKKTVLHEQSSAALQELFQTLMPNDLVTFGDMLPCKTEVNWRIPDCLKASIEMTLVEGGKFKYDFAFAEGGKTIWQRTHILEKPWNLPHFPTDLKNSYCAVSKKAVSIIKNCVHPFKLVHEGGMIHFTDVCGTGINVGRRKLKMEGGQESFLLCTALDHCTALDLSCLFFRQADETNSKMLFKTDKAIWANLANSPMRLIEEIGYSLSRMKSEVDLYAPYPELNDLLTKLEKFVKLHELYYKDITDNSSLNVASSYKRVLEIPRPAEPYTKAALQSYKLQVLGMLSYDANEGFKTNALRIERLINDVPALRKEELLQQWKKDLEKYDCERIALQAIDMQNKLRIKDNGLIWRMNWSMNSCIIKSAILGVLYLEGLGTFSWKLNRLSCKVERSEPTATRFMDFQYKSYHIVVFSNRIAWTHKDDPSLSGCLEDKLLTNILTKPCRMIVQGHYLLIKTNHMYDLRVSGYFFIWLKELVEKNKLAIQKMHYNFSSNQYSFFVDESHKSEMATCGEFVFVLYLSSEHHKFVDQKFRLSYAAMNPLLHYKDFKHVQVLADFAQSHARELGSGLRHELPALSLSISNDILLIFSAYNNFAPQSEANARFDVPQYCVSLILLKFNPQSPQLTEVASKLIKLTDKELTMVQQTSTSNQSMLTHSRSRLFIFLRVSLDPVINIYSLRKQQIVEVSKFTLQSLKPNPITHLITNNSNPLTSIQVISYRPGSSRRTLIRVINADRGDRISLASVTFCKLIF